MLGFTLLGEKMTLNEVLTLICSFFAVSMMILGNYSQETSFERVAAPGWALIVLILNPFIIAVGQIVMRKMKKLHESVVSCYSNLSQFIFITPIAFLTGSDLSLIATFDMTEWLILISMSSL